MTSICFGADGWEGVREQATFGVLGNVPSAIWGRFTRFANGIARSHRGEVPCTSISHERARISRLLPCGPAFCQKKKPPDSISIVQLQRRQGAWKFGSLVEQGMMHSFDSCQQKANRPHLIIYLSMEGRGQKEPRASSRVLQHARTKNGSMLHARLVGMIN